MKIHISQLDQLKTYCGKPVGHDYRVRPTLLEFVCTTKEPSLYPGNHHRHFPEYEQVYDDWCDRCKTRMRSSYAS